MNYSLEDLRHLREEIKEAGLQTDRHSVGDLIAWLRDHKERFERLYSLSLGLPPQLGLTASCFLGPFLKKAANSLAEEMMEDVEMPKEGEDQDRCGDCCGG